MKKISIRAVSVLLVAALVISGLVYYVLEYIDRGQDWAMYFSSANSGSSGEVLDRRGSRLAYFDATNNLFAEDAAARLACYHITGDYWDRTGTGILSNFWNDLQGFSLITGTTQAEKSSMTLTVDSRLCVTAYNALEGRNGAVMVMNYKTGEILCMVSAPTTDPIDGEAEVADGTYINRCLSAGFTPGSVFKLVTSAAAIENIPDIFDRSFYCDGSYDIAGVTITCSGTHYNQTFEQALANSCNCAFAQIAVMLGQDTMVEYVEKYGFLDRHDIDGIGTAAGSYPTEFVGDPELAWSGIGQSTDLVVPFSMLRYVAAIANEGTLVTPHIIMTEESAQGERMLGYDTAVRLRELMSYNVTAHYGGEERFPGLSLCAKTGTAELGDGTSHSWFAGFMNDSEHPYAFVVLVERGGSGLNAAGSVAASVLQAAKDSGL